MKTNKTDYVWRVIKTLIQTFVSAVAIELLAALKVGIDFTSKEAVKGLIMALLAAGLSAVMNIPKLKNTEYEDICDD